MSLRLGSWLDRAVDWLDARRGWFALMCLSAVTLALHRGALSGWWTSDDPLHLKEAILYSPLEYFFVPAVWQRLTTASFTPLLTLSYDLDYTLFGLAPAYFYAHQLIAVALAAISFYLLLTLWVRRAYALLGATLLLLSPPLTLAAGWLAMRHYVEGLALASLALYVWVDGLRRPRAASRWGSSLLYLAAMLAKEVYVPLAVLALLLPERTPRERMRRVWPLGASLAVYLVWRFWMLGEQMGGYGHFSTNWEAVPEVVASIVLLLPLMYFIKLFGLNWSLPLWLGIFGSAVAAWARGAAARRLGLAAAVLVLASVPLVPVVSDLRPDGIAQEQRFVAVPAAMLILALTLGVGRLGGGKGSVFMVPLFVAVGAGLWMQGRTVVRSWPEPAIQRLEGEFLLERVADTDILAVSLLDANYFYRGMDWLRSLTGHGPAPTALYGGYFGLAPGYDVRRLAQRIYRYDASCGCLRDATAAVLRERQMIIGRRAERPFRIRMSWGGGRLAWDLGPYVRGSYFLIAGQRPDWYSSGREVRRQGSLAYALEGYMRVGYQSPEGWVTFSPEFHVNLVEPGRFVWEHRENGAAN